MEYDKRITQKTWDDAIEKWVLVVADQGRFGTQCSFCFLFLEDNCCSCPLSRRPQERNSGRVRTWCCDGLWERWSNDKISKHAIAVLQYVLAQYRKWLTRDTKPDDSESEKPEARTCPNCGAEQAIRKDLHTFTRGSFKCGSRLVQSDICRIRQLEAALKPFAKLAKQIPDQFDDDLELRIFVLKGFCLSAGNKEAFCEKPPMTEDWRAALRAMENTG